MNRTVFRHLLAHHGPRAAASHAAFRAVNLLTQLKIFRGVVVTMQTLDPRLLANDSGRFLERSELQRLATNPENDLDPDFVRRATARGDQCYGFVEGDVLSSHAWFAMYSPAVVGTARMHFSSAYAYRYRSFTHPHFRGRRLRAIGMAHALEELTHDGKQGLVSHVGFDEFDILAASLKVGYRLFGHALTLNVAGTLLTHQTRGCRPYRFHVAEEDAVPAGIRVAEHGTLGLDPRTDH